MSETLSQRPGRLDLELVASDAAEVELSFVDATDAPVDLSGRSWQLRLSGPGFDVNLDAQVVTTSASSGVLSLPFPAATNAAIPAGATWYLRDDTNDRTLLDGELRAFAAGHAGGGSTIEQVVTITNDTAAVTVTAAVAGGGGGGGGGTVDVVSNVATSRILGRASAGSGNSEELTPAQARTLLDVLTAGEVAALLAALVDSAPATLDTLNELAAALGDDPNFATTITAALGGKQAASATLDLLAALSTTAYGRALLTVADLAALRLILAPSGTPSSTTYLRGDGTWSTPAGGGGTVDVVSNVATSTLLGRTTAGSGDSEELTPAAVRTLLALATVATSGNASDLTAGTLAAARLPNIVPFYGTGADGDVTISGNTTLTTDVYYNNLTVNSGVTLTTNGYRVFVAGQLAGSGTISAAGSNGSGLTGGAGGGVATAAPFIAGTTGGAGTTTAGAQSAAGTLNQLGGAGGAGGAGASGGGGALRAVSPPAENAGGGRIVNDPVSLMQARTPGAGTTRLAGGAGGGGGGGDGSSAAGGGGGAGGVVLLVARDVGSFSGLVTAAGGNGATRLSGNVGGGGGGGGGAAILITASTSFGFTISAAGGTAGSGVGTGVDGTAGTVAYFLGVR